VIISLAIGLWYVVFGYDETRMRLPWLKPFGLIIAGVLLAVVTGVVAIFFTGSFLGNVDFGELLGIPLPQGFHISTSFFFEVAICLSVLGSASVMLDSLGHPEHPEIDDQEPSIKEHTDSAEDISWKS
jgi:multisubunit Na+/H+ antiporter MnhB subunit